MKLSCILKEISFDKPDKLNLSQENKKINFDSKLKDIYNKTSFTSYGEQ